MRNRLIPFAFALTAVFLALPAGAQTREDIYAITNARIVTVSGATIEKGTVVVRDGLIEAVGADARVPADARVIDAAGHTVYPGFFDSLTALGLPAPSAPARPQGPGQGGGPQAQQQQPPPSNSAYPVGLQPELSAFDQLRSGDGQFESPRSAGFTTALTVAREGVFNGQSVLINLAGESVSAMTLRSPVAMHFTFRTIPASYPGSLLGTFSAFRQMMLDAQRLRELNKAYDANPSGLRRPASDRSLEALFPVLEGAMPVVFNANTENEINRALDLVREFGIKAVIAGGQEAWKVAPRLKAQAVPVLLSLNFPKRTAAAAADADPESLEVLRFRAEAPRGAAVLAKEGVRFAFQSGGLTSLGDFWTNFAKTVENGLSKETAVRAVTLGPAEIFGVEKSLGSVVPGKIANLTVVRGDVFDSNRFVSHVFVDGRMFEFKERPREQRGPANSGPAPAVAAVGGNYSITIEVPGQPMNGTLSLTQQGASLSGSLNTLLGAAPVKGGRVTADGFTFTASVSMGGSSFDIAVNGKVSGNQISGTIDTPQGAIPFSGTKNP